MKVDKKLLLFGSILIGGMVAGTTVASADTFTNEEAQRIYTEAARKYNVDANLIQSIHIAATDKSYDPLPVTTNNNAQGPFQISPNTWVGWSYEGEITSTQLYDSNFIELHDGIGIDGNGDGKVDPSNFVDSVYACANFLNKNDSNHKLGKALDNYSKDPKFVEKVRITYASITPDANDANISTNQVDTFDNFENEGIEYGIQQGLKLVGKSPYVFGAGRTDSDIANRSFDCSSFVRWVFEQGGISVGNISSTTTWSLLEQGHAVSKEELKRGDIIFFDTYTANGHVGIYLGDGKFLNDQSTHGVWIDDLNESYWASVFNGNIRRIN